MQAQADNQAEVMRKKLEAKRQQRGATFVTEVLTPLAASRAEEEGQVVLRKMWGAPAPREGRIALMARQVDATGIITGGGVCG